MTPRVVVLVPYRPDGGQRDVNWSFLRQQYWTGVPFDLIEGVHEGPAPFSRSAAVNDAATRAGRWDIAVIADADVFVPLQQLDWAVTRARRSASLILAHDQWLSLDRETTASVLAGAEPPLTSREGRRFPVSGIMAINRHTWDRVGGFDEGFTQYGWEDHAFARACELASGVQRVPGLLWHLWHEPVRVDGTRPEGRWAAARADAYRRARSLEDLARL